MSLTESSRRVRRQASTRVAAVLVIAAFLLALPGGGGAWAGDGVSFTQKGVSADAFWERCTTERGLTTCTFTGLFAFEGREKFPEGSFRGTRACLFVDTFSFRERGRGGPPGDDTIEFESGCATAAAGTLSVGSGLSSASLQPTTVSLDKFECTFEDETGEETCVIVSSRDVSISADWNAVGDLLRFSERFTFRVGNCKETFTGKGEFREAAATGSLDGASLGEPLFGGIRNATFTFRSTCPFMP